MMMTGDALIRDHHNAPQVHHPVRDPDLLTRLLGAADRRMRIKCLYFVSMVYSAVFRFLEHP